MRTKFKKQKSKKYDGIKRILSVIRSDIMEKSIPLSRVDKLYASRLEREIFKAFGVTVNIFLQPNEYLYHTTFPDIPYLSDLNTDVKSLLDPKTREAYLGSSKDLVRRFLDLDGSVDYSSAELKGEYTDLTGEIYVDPEYLCKTYNFSVDDLLALYLNEIGKYVTFMSFLDGMKTTLIESEKRNKKTKTLSDVWKEMRFIQKDQGYRVVELKKKMDEMDELSSSFVMELGYARELTGMTLKLRKAVKSVNAKRWLRVIPSILRLMGSVMVAAWAVMTSFLAWSIGVVTITSKLLGIVMTFVFMSVFVVASTVITVYAVVTGISMLLTAKDYVSMPKRLRKIRRAYTASLKKDSSMLTPKELRDSEMVVSIIREIEEVEIADTGILDRIFSSNTEEDLLKGLADNTLFLSQMELTMDAMGGSS